MQSPISHGEQHAPADGKDRSAGHAAAVLDIDQSVLAVCGAARLDATVSLADHATTARLVQIAPTVKVVLTPRSMRRCLNSNLSN